MNKRPSLPPVLLGILAKLKNAVLIVLLIGLLAGSYVAGSHRVDLTVAGMAIKQYQSIKNDLDAKSFAKCVNENPEVTVIGAGYYGEYLLDATVVATPNVGMYFELSEYKKQSNASFGSVHRSLFVCAAKYFPKYETLQVTYVYWEAFEAFDGKPHLIAHASANVAFMREVAQEGVTKTRDAPPGNLALAEYIINHIDNGIYVDPMYYFFDVQVAASYLKNGDINLGLKRFQDYMDRDEGVYPPR